MHDIKVIGTRWNKERGALRDIRQQVFILEQGVPQNLEWDALDDGAEHFVAYMGSDAVGCARLVEHKKITRMAVLQAYRKQGVGRKIIDHIKRYASQKRYTRLHLSAQCHAFEFYRLCGFNACSTPYDDVGIPHIDMECLVFSQSDEPSQYQLAHDSSLYTSRSALVAKGYLDILLSQCEHTIHMFCADLSHPLSKDDGLISTIRHLIKRNRHVKAQVLLAQYHPSNNDHPLFKLMSRLPSFVAIRLNPDASDNLWLLDDSAWFVAHDTASRVCYADRGKVKTETERFNRCWQSSKAIPAARRLSI